MLYSSLYVSVILPHEATFYLSRHVGKSNEKKKKDNIIAFHSLSSSMRNLEAQRRMVHNTLFRIQKSNSTTNKHIFFTYNQGKKKEFQAFDS